MFIKTCHDDSGDEAYSVFIDGLAITTSSSFLSAFACYLAAYYCFNLSYPASLRKTLQFFQRVMLNIQDTLKIDKSVVKILDKINQILC